MMDSPPKEDLRIAKTNRALKAALLTLLSRRTFSRITINDLCKEALVSRATFYAHFDNKYDLLRAWLADVRKGIVKDISLYEELEGTVNQFICENKKTIVNVLKYTDAEVLEAVQEFMSDIIELATKRRMCGQENPSRTILYTFCVGGLVQLLLWQVKNNFPPDLKMMNRYLYKMLKCIREWDAEQAWEKPGR